VDVAIMNNIFTEAKKNISRSLIENISPGGKWVKDEYWTLNPLRKDTKPGSFSINENGFYNDFATGQSGDLFKLISEKDRISPTDAAKKIIKLSGVILPESNLNSNQTVEKLPWKNTKQIPSFFKTKPDLITAYDTERGDRAFVICRWNNNDKKIIVPYYYNNRDKWSKGMPELFNKKRPLYNLKNIINSTSPILIVEGEKCANVSEKVLKNYTVTTWHGGAGSVHLTDWEVLKDKKVIVCPDADNTGLDAALRIKKILPDAEILDVRDKPEKWDIADAINEGIDLEKFISNCPRFSENKNLPEIDATDQDLTYIVPAAWDAIRQANTKSRLVLFGGVPCRITKDESGTIVERLDNYMLQFEAALSAQWRVYKKSIPFPCRPPMSIVMSMQAYENKPLPILKRIVQAPVFSVNGKLQTTPGYHSDSLTFYAPGNLQIKDVPDKPTDEDLKKSLNIINEMFQDFPFTGDADKAHAIATMLLPFVRDIIRGPVPALVIEASEAGTGKGLISNCIMHPAIGGSPDIFSPADKQEEQRKRITAILSKAPVFFFTDNINDLSGPQYAVLLTSVNWSDRLLSKTETATFPINSVFIFTGNNVSISTELSRRIIKCRIEAKTDRPWLRNDFKINNLSEWVRIHRSELVRACLVICQYWIAAGMPTGKVKPLGSFEEYTKVMGGILETAGITGFLGNIIEVYDHSDSEGKAIRQLIIAWYEWQKNQSLIPGQSANIKALELFPIATEIEGLPINGKSEQSMRRSFSRFLSKNRQRIFSVETSDGLKTLQIAEAGISKTTSLWKLVSLDNKENTSRGEENELEYIPF